MLTTQSNRYISPDIERLIKDVIFEDSQHDRELRSIHREKIVLPVTLRFMNGLPSMGAFSRNLSSSGICLVTHEEVQPQLLAMVQLYRINETENSEVVGECRWTRPFGPDYHLSGWQFLRLPSS